VRGERSLIDVVHDIFGNVQDIVRSEISLAKAEVAHELDGAKSYALSLFIGTFSVAVTALFVLLSGMYALTLVLQPWAAALATAGVAALIGVAAFVFARRRKTRPLSGLTAGAPIKENTAWPEQSIK
jgi:Putative Actinobacterial Holin-X, holin superfamily III